MLDACTHFTYTILIKKSTKDTIHFCSSISRKMPITSHIFVPLLVHLFDVMQWHMYNVITITRRNNVCDNSLHLYYCCSMSISQNCYHNVTNYDNIFVQCNLHPKMFHNLCSLKLRCMCCYHYHIDHCWPLSL